MFLRSFSVPRGIELMSPWRSRTSVQDLSTNGAESKMLPHTNYNSKMVCNCLLSTARLFQQEQQQFYWQDNRAQNRVTVHFTNTHCWSRRHGPLYFHTGETLRSIRSLQMEHYYIAALKPDTCGLCNVHDQAESDKPTEKVLAFLFLFYGMQLFWLKRLQ